MKPSARSVLMAKTLLFNYGRGDRTPHQVFHKLCAIVEVKPDIPYPPEFKLLPIHFSFFSKQSHQSIATEDFGFSLCYGYELRIFLGLGTVEKLAWLYNFTDAQCLLFQNTQTELEEINLILRDWKRPQYDAFFGRDKNDLINRSFVELKRGDIRAADGSIIERPHLRRNNGYNFATAEADIV